MAMLFANGATAVLAEMDIEPIFSLDISGFDASAADSAKGLADATGNGGEIVANTRLSGELVLEDGTVTPYLVFEGNSNQDAKNVRMRPVNLDANPQELTVEFWANLDIERCSNYAKLYMAVDAADTWTIPMFLQRFQRDDGANKNSVALAANGSGRTAWTPFDAYANKWTHYMITHTWSEDNTTVTTNLYCDGKLVLTGGPYAGETRIMTTGGLLFSIGAIAATDDQSAFMQVGSFNIYDSALSGADAAALYAQSKSRFVNPPIRIQSHQDGETVTYPVQFSGEADLGNAEKLMVSEDQQAWTELAVENGAWRYDILNGDLGSRTLYLKIEDAAGASVFETSRSFQAAEPIALTIKSAAIENGEARVTLDARNLHQPGTDADTEFLVVSAAYAQNRMLAYAAKAVTGLSNGGSTELNLAMDIDGETAGVYLKTFAIYGMDNRQLVSNICLYPQDAQTGEEGDLEVLTPASGVRLAFAPQADTGMLKFGVASASRKSGLGATIVVYDYMGNIDYIDAGRTDADGKWRGSYVINNTEIGKEFNIYCAAGQDQAQGNFRFYTQDSIDEALALVKATDYTKIYDEVFNKEPYKFIFALDFTQYDLLSDPHKAYVMAAVAGQEYARVEDVQNCYITACDSQKKLQDIETADPQDLENGTARLLRDSGFITDFETYYGQLSDEDKKAFLSAWIHKQVFQTGEALQQAFAEGERVTYINSLQKAALVQARVFHDRYADFGLSAADVSYYSSLSSTNQVKMMEYFKTANIERLAQIRPAFLAAETKLKEELDKKGHSGGGSSGGGGGGGFSGPSITVIPPVEHTNQPVAEEDKVEETKRNQFTDLDQDHWAYTYIIQLLEAGIVSGTSDTTFEPDRAVNREEFLKMLLDALQIAVPADGTADFADIEPGAWYEKYVAAGAAAQIVSGYADGTFGVGRTLTRSEMCVLMTRALEAANKKLSFVADPIEFTDQSQIPDFSKEAVSALQRADIISGIDGSFQPAGSATRAMAARVICAMLDNIQ